VSYLVLIMKPRMLTLLIPKTHLMEDHLEDHILGLWPEPWLED